MTREDREDGVHDAAAAKVGDDRPAPDPWPIRATVKPEGRWGAAGWWMWGSTLAVGVGGVIGLFLVAERLRQIVVVLEGR